MLSHDNDSSSESFLKGKGWGGFSPKWVFTEAGFHRISPKGWVFTECPWGEGFHRISGVVFPLFHGRFGESPPQWVFTECPYRWVFTECPLGVVIHRMYHKTVGYHPWHQWKPPSTHASSPNLPSYGLFPLPLLSKVRGKGPKLGEPCPKVRLSQDRMPIFPSPPPAKLGEGRKA